MKFHPKRRPSAYEHYREKRPKITYVGATLTDFQRKIAEKVVNGEERFYVWAASRQSGKSYLALQLLLYFALNRADSVSMFVSMTHPQSEKVFNELIRACKDSGVISSYSKSSHTVEFVNNSVIYFKSYQNADSARGYHISGLLVVDEASWMASDENSNDFDMIFLPMLQNHRQSKCLIISSPRGTNWFYKYYLRGQRSGRWTNKSVISFHSTYLDNPFCDKNEIEELRKSLPDAIFRQEFMAEFISHAMSAFGETYKKCLQQYDYSTLKPSPYEKYYMGIDVGRNEDYTVATVISSISGKVVDILRIRQTTYDNIANEIVKLAKKWKPSAILCEVNGIGDVFFELLARKIEADPNRVSPLKSFLTTNQSKNNIVEALKIAFENGDIIIPDDIELTDEIESFECNYSKSAHAVVYGAKSGKHDDMVMSLCIANWCRRNHAHTGQYAVV